MASTEHGLAMIDIIAALTQLEIDDIDGIDLANHLVVLSQIDILRDGLAGAIFQENLRKSVSIRKIRVSVNRKL